MSGTFARKLASLGVAAIAIGLVVRAMPIAWLELHEPFARDQGVFMYVAFALSKGVRDYAGIHEQNGPFVHLLWLFFYKLAGDDELVVRAIELAGSVAVFFAFGAALPGVARRPIDPRSPVSFASRCAWGLFALAILGADYLSYIYWERAQRESLFNLFLISSIAIQLVAQGSLELTSRARLNLIGLAGALVVLPGFGKPPAFLFVLAQLLGLLLDDETKLSRKRRALAFSIGLAAGCVPIAIFVLRYADVGAMLRFVLYEAPRLHYYIWHNTLVRGWSMYGNATRLDAAAIVTVLGLLALLLRQLPRRAWSVWFFLVASWGTLAVQGKMFPYQLFTLSAATAMMALVLIRLLFDRERTLVGVIAVVGLAFVAHQRLSSSPTTRSMTPARMAAARTRQSRREELPKLYNGPTRAGEVCPMMGADFYAWDLRQAGRYLREVLPEQERVQLWGMDVYLLFFAQRLNATPLIYSYEIDVGAALRGGVGGQPSAAQASWLRKKSAENARLLLEQLRAAPPGALALIDNQPFLCAPDAERDFKYHVPEIAQLMHDRYVEARRFGPVRIWLRSDLSRAP